MTTYTYSIYDSNPAASDGNVWPAHDSVEIEAESIEDAVEQVRGILEVEASGLSASDGYEVGQELHTIIEDDAGIIVGTPKYALTADDLGIAEEEE